MTYEFLNPWKGSITPLDSTLTHTVHASEPRKDMFGASGAASHHPR